MSISWHPSEDVLVTGGIDNIRLWSVKSGRAIQRLTLGRQKNKETVVWCVAILRYGIAVTNLGPVMQNIINLKQFLVKDCLTLLHSERQKLYNFGLS